MRFAALGPYRVPVSCSRNAIEFDKCDEVFGLADAEMQERFQRDVRNAIGCYVLALRPSGSKRDWPYYVGQACRQTFYKRVFQKQDKEEKFNSIVRESGYKKASVQLYLFPLLTSTGRLARLGSNTSLIDRAEFALIGLGRSANEDLWNIKHRIGMDAFEIDGAFNSAARTQAARRVRAMFDL